jgi:hypothetical protein
MGLNAVALPEWQRNTTNFPKINDDTGHIFQTKACCSCGNDQRHTTN